jgi:hypothetical protein
MLGPISRVFTDIIHLRVSLLPGFSSRPPVQHLDYYGKLAGVALGFKHVQLRYNAFTSGGADVPVLRNHSTVSDVRSEKKSFE